MIALQFYDLLHYGALSYNDRYLIKLILPHSREIVKGKSDIQTAVC
jgi:hypothetical protein